MADNDYALGLLVEKVASSRYKDSTLIFVVEDDAQNGGDHVDAHRSIALVVGSFVKREEVISNHYTTVSLVRTIVDVLGMKSPGLNDALAEPMAEIFDSSPRPWTYTAEVPPILYTTQLPLPSQTLARHQGRTTGAVAIVQPLRSAEYWERAMAGQNFEREDDLSTDAFNMAL
jgi:hypothetical protein